MSKRDFSRPPHRTSTHNRNCACTMMRRTHRSCNVECAARSLAKFAHPNTRTDSHDFQRFFSQKWRQNPSERARQHGLSTSSRSKQQRIMPPRCSDQHRTLRKHLPFDISKVHRRESRRWKFVFVWQICIERFICEQSRRRWSTLAPKKCDDFTERRCADHFHARNERCFNRIFYRHDDSTIVITRHQCSADRSTNRTQSTIECEFASDQPIRG